MNKTIKIISVLLLAIILLSATNMVFATELKPGDVTPNYEGQDSSELEGKAEKILGWIRNIAAIISVVILAILGVKFMIGSTEERAEYKKSFMPLIIGMFVVLAASTIAGWIWSVLV